MEAAKKSRENVGAGLYWTANLYMLNALYSNLNFFLIDSRHPIAIVIADNFG